MSETPDPSRVKGDREDISGLTNGSSLGARIFNPLDPALSRSSKLRRPRGLLCCVGMCPNCMMRVDGVPNVRVCQYVTKGLPRVEVQNRFPVIDRLNLLTRMHRFLKVGFQYQMLFSRGFEKRAFFSLLRRSSGLGQAVSETKQPSLRLERIQADVMVIGGGPSGLAAALEASRDGARVILVDSNPLIGGEFPARWGGSKLPELREDSAQLERLCASLAGSPNLRVVLGTTVVAYYDNEEVLMATSDSTRYEVSAKAVIVATGSHEVLPAFTNNDSPRVMLSLCAQRLLNDGADLRRRTVVIDNNGEGVLVAAGLMDRGVEVALVSAPGDFTEEASRIAQKRGLRLEPESLAIEISEHRLTLSCREEVRRVETDNVVVCGRRQPNYEIAAMLGCGFAFVREGSIKQGFSSTIGAPKAKAYLAGSVGGRVTTLRECVDEGRTVGEAVRRGGGHSEQQIMVQLDPDRYLLRAIGSVPKEAYVCLCEDVTLTELMETIRNGYDTIETLKRFTGAVTGPCQGKQCALTVASILAHSSKRELETSPFTTARPPVTSIPFSSLLDD